MTAYGSSKVIDLLSNLCYIVLYGIHGIFMGFIAMKNRVGRYVWNLFQASANGKLVVGIPGIPL